MKVSTVITVISFTVFGVLILSALHPAVRMVGITVAYIPSIASSGLCFYYFHKIPDSRYSLLTTSAKSNVGYHILLATVYYIRELAFFSTTLKDSWEISPNETCFWDLSMYLLPLATAATAQLQVLRCFMTVMPLTFIELDHGFLAYPLVASVPLTTVAVMFMIYSFNGSLCDRLGVVMLKQRLNLDIDIDNILFATVDTKKIFLGISLLLEGLIRIYMNWKNIKRSVKSVIRCCVNNAVVPITTMMTVRDIIIHSVDVEVSAIPVVLVVPAVPVESVEHIVYVEPVVPIVPDVSDGGIVTLHSLQSTDTTVTNAQQIPSQYEKSKPASDLYANSPLIISTFIFLMTISIFSFASNVTFFIVSVMLNFYLWTLPMIWISKQEIKKFIKLKYSQMMARFGYF